MSHRSVPRVAIFVAGGATAVLVAACQAPATVSGPVIITPTVTYARDATARCLMAHRVVLLNIPRTKLAAWIKPLLPPGIEGDLAVIGPTNMPKFIAPVDNVVLYFFSNPSQARSGVKQLARFHYYGDGVPASHRMPWDLHPPPKSAAAAVALQEIAGNVAIFWQNPRHRVAYSNRLIKSCLRS